MTTTIYDRAKGVIACDSRWSIPDDRFGVLYVDEAPYLKIEIAQNHAFVFAGKAPIIGQWKVYLRARAEGQNLPVPPMQGIAALVAEIGSGKLKHYYKQDIILPDVFDAQTIFAGTGSTHAARCWQANQCPARAVASAMNFDICTGGEVRYVELLSGQHNLSHCHGIESLNQAFLHKGMVMFNRSELDKSPIPFKDAAGIDPNVAEWYNKAASGSLLQDIQAPCDAVFGKPTAEDETRMKDVLDSIFG